MGLLSNACIKNAFSEIYAINNEINLGSLILVNIQPKSKNRAETNQPRWAKQTSHTSVVENDQKPQNCILPELLHKVTAQSKEGFNSENRRKIISTHVLMNNVEE